MKIEDLCTFIIIPRPVLIKIGKVSDKNCRETRNTHIVFSTLFSKIMPFMRLCGKTEYSQTGHRRRQRMRIACWIPKATDTVRICNTHCFSTAIMVTQTRLSVTLYVHYLSCYLMKTCPLTPGSCGAEKLSLKYKPIYSRTPI
jgi:hypothetical protein